MNINDIYFGLSKLQTKFSLKGFITFMFRTDPDPTIFFLFLDHRKRIRIRPRFKIWIRILP